MCARLQGCRESCESKCSPKLSCKKEYTLKAYERLKSKKLAQQLFEHGKAINLHPIRLVYLSGEPTSLFCHQVLFIVPKRNVKRAVDRNAIKRRMREAYRLNKRLLDHSTNCFLLAYIYVSSHRNPVKGGETKKKNYQMALLLSIETCTSICSVALHREGNLVAFQQLAIAHSHAESLLPMVDHLLQLSGYTLKDLKAVAISQGPGSYTGLRIGAATATGLCYALNIPLIAVGTLEAMVEQVKLFNINQHVLYCPMIDARRMEVYCLVADATSQVIQEAHPHIITSNSFEQLLKENTIVFFGDGAEKCKAVFSASAHAIVLAGIRPSAASMGLLAYQFFQKEQFVDLMEFTPMYLKPFQSHLPNSSC
eukprot:gene227-303_t